MWKKCRKKPIIVEFREVEGEEEIIKTKEGDLMAHKNKSFIIRGAKGELYPIDKKIFYETYEILEDN